MIRRWARQTRMVRGRLLALAVGVVAAGIWWRTAWVSDDAYLTFRTLDVWFAGHGPNFNAGQRVWGSTSPLWFLLLGAGRLVHSDPYWVALALSAACMLAALSFAWRILADPLAWSLLLLLLLGSRALLDYSSSGLETPLSYAVLTAFFWRYSRLFERGPSEARLRALGWVTGLLLITRHDLLLLAAPPLAWVFARFRSALPTRRWLLLAALSSAPIVLWTAFSLFYYGSALPPAARSKLGYSEYGDRTEVWMQGVRNLQVLLYDPVSIALLVVGFEMSLRRRRSYAPFVLGGLLYLGVFVYHGGDWMDARIFTPLLISLLPLAARGLLPVVARTRALAVAAGAMLWLVWPQYPWVVDSPTHIVVQRELMRSWNDFYRGVSDRSRSDRSDCPDWEHLSPAQLFDVATPVRMREITTPAIVPVFLGQQVACGRWLRETRFPIAGVRFGALGLFSYFAGPEKWIVEKLLLDPLLTRLPPSHGGRFLHHSEIHFRPGHVMHELPPGYGESLLGGGNRIEDPDIARLYDDVRLATQGPLLAAGRLGAIWRLNTGHDYGTDAPWRAAWE